MGDRNVAPPAVATGAGRACVGGAFRYGRGMSIRCFSLALFLGSVAHGGEADFKEVVGPFLKEHCVECHGPEKQKGKLRLDVLGGISRTRGWQRSGRRW